MAQHNELGKKGEEIAADFLQKAGYEILERNWVFQKAELDIIAQKDTILAIVEVKTRTSADFGLPQDFVKGKKIQNLAKAVDQYMNENDLDLEVRFDIIGIVLNNQEITVEHLEDAFYYF
ncbi:MAG TPA: YraN family protein [Flavobacterium sp.]|uniref:YraN family protein n=1 Tax=unclassified Flavobacterium TaxID=196869 RepID=UPI000E8FB4BC|nr:MULTISPECIES: YraN family protein [unclassified Flavobacterium]HBI01252.1 YraN family protein [Flavobacterium sp.]HRE76544.1 YraN family protein [Flavobacterium sp.]